MNKKEIASIFLFVFIICGFTIMDIYTTVTILNSNSGQPMATFFVVGINITIIFLIGFLIYLLINVARGRMSIEYQPLL